MATKHEIGKRRESVVNDLQTALGVTINAFDRDTELQHVLQLEQMLSTVESQSADSALLESILTLVDSTREDVIDDITALLPEE